MVKADPKHDYYADLELPATADAETIKRQFRLLAKQYHPDRNPGKEIDVIPKFQAIQAANEILGDPAQKKRYDADRAVSAQTNEPASTTTYSNGYKKPAKPPPPAPNFPPPPKRDPNLNRPFNPRPQRPTSSASAEKFAPFTRAAPQQWDRAKFEDAAKAETLRNLHNMRPQSQGPPPRVPPRAPPTAPKPVNTATSPEMPQNSGPSPGFPGLSRTNSSGRRGGFAPGASVNDEAPAQSSAYAHVHRSDRPPSVAAGHSYPPQYGRPGMATSPPTQRTRPSMSPLRTSKSSGFEDVHRSGSQTSLGRYATNPGEKTNINGPGVQRSASVRNSPTGQRWAESGPFGRHQPQQQSDAKAVPPRNHSTSPLGRSATTGQEWSASETSSSEDEPPPTMRPKVIPRKPLNKPLPNDPALTGQFSRSNYNTKIDESRYYQYPAPGSNATAPHNPVDDITQGLNNTGIRHVHKDDVPLKKYEFPISYSKICKPWIDPISAKIYPGCDHRINGIPAWALPASVYPRKHSVFDQRDPLRVPTRVTRSEFPKSEDPFCDDLGCSDHFTDILNSQSSQHTSGVASETQSAANNSNGIFSPADWDGKFADNENIFRPQESKSRSRSPAKTSRPKLPNRNRSGPNETDTGPNTNEENSFQMPGVRHVSGTGNGFGKSAAFEPVKFSAEDWAERLRNQSNSRGPKIPPREKPNVPNVATKQPSVRDEVEVEEHPSSPEKQSQPQAPGAGPDAMDVDDSLPQQVPPTNNHGTKRMPSDSAAYKGNSSDINLKDLKETAPFKPRVSGLGDLGDLGDTLPFESRAAKEINLHQAPSAGAAGRHLNLPAPPKPVVAPDDAHLTQESWSAYSDKMSRYMDAWNIFNCKMIDHFRTRQEQISLAMYHNWVTAVGDGASADDFHGLDFVGSDTGTHDQVNGHTHAKAKPKKAGYATYMQWLEQDRVCRTWWDVAFDEHTQCMEELGRVRRMVKSIRAHEFEKHA